MGPMEALMQRGAGLKLFEQRTCSEVYREFVFYNNQLPDWQALFAEFFGPPGKPAGKPPSSHDKKLAKDYGGIRSDQTLYFKKDGESVTIAMFWPWGDGAHTTVKIAVLQ